MICSNINTIKKTITETALRCGRDPSEITLVAVSKRMDTAKIQEAFQCGQRCFGENFVQEAREKIENLDPSIAWHFIGHLQSNKAMQAARLFTMIETVDRLKIARALNKYAAEHGKYLDILVQVNVGLENQKSGIKPEDGEKFMKDLTPLNNLKIKGLMTMPPYSPDPEKSRPHFRALKQIAAEFQQKGFFADNTSAVLSMGMTSDYIVAIEEGATLVRVGTGIFGKRT